jgi:hypothetical protein
MEFEEKKFDTLIRSIECCSTTVISCIGKFFFDFSNFHKYEKKYFNRVKTNPIYLIPNSFFRILYSEIYKNKYLQIFHSGLIFILYFSNIRYFSSSTKARTMYSNLRREGVNLLEKLVNILKREQEDKEAWSSMINKRTMLIDESIETSFRGFVLNNIVESLRVLFDEFASKDSSLDIKEKSKTIIKILNSYF